MRAGGGAKRNVSLEQGAQVSTATQRAATTTRHSHTEKLSGSVEILTNLYAYLDQQRGRDKLLHKVRFVAQKNCTTFESKHMSSEAWRNPYAK